MPISDPGAVLSSLTAEASSPSVPSEIPAQTTVSQSDTTFVTPLPIVSQTSEGSDNVPPSPVASQTTDSSGNVASLPVASQTAEISDNGTPKASQTEVASIPVVITQPDTTITTKVPITDPAGAISTALAGITSGIAPVISVPVVISNSQTVLTADVPITNPAGAISSAIAGVISGETPITETPTTVTNAHTTFTTDVPVIPTQEPVTTAGIEPGTISGGIPSIVVVPTAPASLEGPIESAQPSVLPAPASGSGIVFGPSGIVTSSDSQPTGAEPIQTGASPASQSQGAGVFPGSQTAAPNSQGAVASQTAGDSGLPVSSGVVAVPGNTETSSEPSAVPSAGVGSQPSTSVELSGHSAATSITPEQSGTQNQNQVSHPSGSEPSVVPPSTTGGDQVSNSLASGFSGLSAEPTGAAGTSAPSQSGSQPSGLAPGATDSIVSGAANTLSGSAQTGTTPAAAPVNTQASASTPDAVQPASAQITTQIPANQASQTQAFGGHGPQSLVPTATDSFTSQAVPSSIIGDTTESTQSMSSMPTGIPSSLPHVITPPGGAPDQPANTTLIQIGFLYPLNYPFVLANSLSQRQIFKFMPPGIAYGLGIHENNVTMQTLRAYDTTKDLRYITTLALAYIPSNMVEKLTLDLHAPVGDIYNNPDKSIKTLFSMVNPQLPIMADDSMGSSPTSNTGSPSSTPSDSIEPGAPFSGGMGNDMPVRPSAAGIGVGVVAGAAAYGAAMFFVARRYKQRRQSHQHSPSLLSSPVMSGSRHDLASAALMSGARGDGLRSASPMDGYGYGRNSRGSGRSGSTGRQQISAPVMAENSLGWN